jgi:C4-dicarboxylate-specific signal transduction histidine kinase
MSRFATTSVARERLPRLEGDRIQLQQVMLNLINNAVQAMSAAGIESRDLVISSKTDRDGIVVTVRDTGPGLDTIRFT